MDAAARRRAGSASTSATPSSPRSATRNSSSSVSYSFPGTANNGSGNGIPLLSPRDADHEFFQLANVFTGKETEDNWERRDDALRRLKQLMRSAHVGQDPWIHQPAIVEAVVNGVRNILDPVLAATLSLRTALVVTACAALNDVVVTLNRNLDPVAESMVLTLSKLIGSTKKLVHTSGAQCLASVLVHCSLKQRIVDKVVALVEDKNMQIRSYAMAFVYEVLLSASTAVANGVPQAAEVGTRFADAWERAMKKGMSDSNPAVREASRDCYFEFEKLAINRAHALAAKLDANARKALAKGPGKPRPSMLAVTSSTMSVSSSPSSSGSFSARTVDSTPSRTTSLSNNRTSPASPYITTSPLASSDNFPHYQQQQQAPHSAAAAAAPITGGAFGAAISSSSSSLSHPITPTAHPKVRTSTASPYDGSACDAESDNPTTTTDDDVNAIDDDDGSDNLEIWLEAFEDALASSDTTTALQCLTYMLHVFSEAIGAASSPDDHVAARASEQVMDGMAPPLRKALLIAMTSNDDSLALAALDDPALLWAAFSSSTDDAIDLVVALTDTLAMFGKVVEPMVAECHAEAVRSVFVEDKDAWVRVLGGAIESAGWPEGAKVVGGWIRQAVGDDAVDAWAEGREGSEEDQRIAMQIKEADEAKADADGREANDAGLPPRAQQQPQGVTSSVRSLVVEPHIEDLDPPSPSRNRDMSPVRSTPSPSKLGMANGRSSLANDVDPVEDLVLAMADARVSIVELYRYTAHVHAHEPPPVNQLLDQVGQLLAYARRDSDGDSGSAGGDDENDVSSECVLAVHHVLDLVPTDRRADALAVVLQHARGVSPTSPLAYWFEQCVADLVGKDSASLIPVLAKSTAEAAKVAESSIGGNDAASTDPPYSSLLGYLVRAIDSLNATSGLAPPAAITAARDELETVLRVSMRSPSSFARLAGVKLAVALTRCLGDAFLDDMVGSQRLDPVHRRLVLGYAARANGTGAAVVSAP
ncbi:clasp N terminal-domain-containing protein [Catenaria anguillulae PL171]|uniref:Clasp N terminal-domain-containing protein n=1 Tax=Catenaria anguillulae PL171 TaxID=765915 RepID=A0A1Y2I085_9FUNG|nr:clasp N terminal-domain-containing protein [Catenaria anguillulae PL171]